MKVEYWTAFLWLLQIPVKIFAFCWLIAMILLSGLSIWSLSWPVTEARIVESAISKIKCNRGNGRNQDNPGEDVFFIKYKFVARGSIHIGNRVTLTGYCNANDPRFAAKYPVGIRVPVHYAPSSILSMEYLEASMDWGFAALALFFTLVISFFGFFPLRKRTEFVEK